MKTKWEILEEMLSWSADEEIVLVLAKSEAEQREWARTYRSAWPLDEECRGDVSLVATGALCLSLRGVVEPTAIAARLGTSVEKVQEAFAHLDGFRAKIARHRRRESEERARKAEEERAAAARRRARHYFDGFYFTLEETTRYLDAAGYDATCIRGDECSVQLALEVVWCEQKGLYAPRDIARALRVSTRKVQRAIDQLRFAAKPMKK